MNAAANLKDLKFPPNNKLEALKGSLVGHHSIRVNDQWRVPELAAKFAAAFEMSVEFWLNLQMSLAI